MILIPLVFIAALVLEVLGGYISVIGLSSKSSIILIILAVSLDFSKIVIASVLYRNWKELNLLFKTFLLPATLFLMAITSYGAYAFLLQEFSKTTAVQEQLRTQLESMEVEQAKLQDRKKEIDAQIAQVSPQFVTQKKRLNEMFAQELTYLNTRIVELDKQIPETKTSMMKDTTQAGTLGSLAKTWGTTPDQTAKIIALMMVVVIDPLAIVMLMVGSFLQEKRKKEIEQKKLDEENKEFELKKMQIAAQNQNFVQPNILKTVEPTNTDLKKETKQIEEPDLQAVNSPVEIQTKLQPEEKINPIKKEEPNLDLTGIENTTVKEIPIIKEEHKELSNNNFIAITENKNEVDEAIISAITEEKSFVAPLEKEILEDEEKTEEDIIKSLENSLVGKMPVKKVKNVWEESAPLVQAQWENLEKISSKNIPENIKHNDEDLDNFANTLEKKKVENVQIEAEDPFDYNNSDLDEILREVEDHDKPPVLKKMSLLKSIEPFDLNKHKQLNEDDENDPEGFDTKTILAEEKLFGN